MTTLLRTPRIFLKLKKKRFLKSLFWVTPLWHLEFCLLDNVAHTSAFGWFKRGFLSWKMSISYIELLYKHLFWKHRCLTKMTEIKKKLEIKFPSTSSQVFIYCCELIWNDRITSFYFPFKNKNQFLKRVLRSQKANFHNNRVEFHCAVKKNLLIYSRAFCILNQDLCFSEC